ncbi:MAG: SLC13 family permease [Rubrivivax sp.]
MAVFAVVYAGMFLGGLPHVKLDRTGVALLGAIAMIAITGMPVEEAARSVDLPTLVLLFAFMVVSAQMRLGGFYAAVTRFVAALPLARGALLAALIAVAAALSAVFSNDVVCLAMTPVVARLALERRLDPVPLLVGLACAANIGSALTLIGNPQNMLIGSLLALPFGGYVRAAWLPVLLSLALLWLWLAFGPPGRGDAMPGIAPAPRIVPTTSAAAAGDDESPPYDAVQAAKGLVVAGALMAVFLFTGTPRDQAALVGAGVLLLSRRLHSAQVMGYVDWPLLLLFIGLFVVNHAFQGTGLAAQAVAWLAQQGVHVREPSVLSGRGVVEPRFQRARGDAAAAASRFARSAGQRGGRHAAGAGEHLRRQPVARGVDRQPHRRRPRREGWRAHRLGRARAHRRAGDAGVAGRRLGLARVGRPLT